MPAMQPKDLWEESGRWDRYVQDGILFHFKERKGSEVCLGPTHEEVITNYVRALVQSHKQLPVTLYQIQTKFRDEFRPRFGPAARARVHHEGRLHVPSRPSMAVGRWGRGLSTAMYARSYRRRLLPMRAATSRVVAAEAGPIGGSGTATSSWSTPTPARTRSLRLPRRGPGTPRTSRRAEIGERSHNFAAAAPGRGLPAKSVHDPRHAEDMRRPSRATLPRRAPPTRCSRPSFSSATWMLTADVPVAVMARG